MYKTTTSLLFTFSLLVLFSMNLQGQILSIDPVFPTVEDTVTIVYDATQGNGALTGVSPVYAHAGVITNLSTTPTDWKYVQGTWGTPDPKVLMQNLGNNKHQIKYHIRSYYGVPLNETVEELAFVFRNADGSKVGRDTDGSDIYYPVYSGGVLDIAILTPAAAVFAAINDVIAVKAAASDSSALTLYENGALIFQTSGKSLVYSYSPASSGNKWIKFQANNGTTIKADSFLVVVSGPQNIASLPVGVQPGINEINDSTVILALYAPNKNSVYAVGDFSNWLPGAEYQMNLSPDSTTYWIQIDGLTPGQEYAYQYLVNGTLKIADPYAEKVLDPWNDSWISTQTYPNLKPYPQQTEGIVSVFQTARPEYSWQTTAWERPDPAELVVYELLIRDFIAAHDYKTLIDTLPYLQNLGINAIELMPIMEFEGNSSWGYNVSYFFAADKYYGPEADLKAFIDTCHSRGIVVILDMVLNHAFGQNSLVQLYWDAANNRPSAENPWFNPIAKHPFNVGYDFNHESPQTQYFADRVLAYWVNEYQFDGFRMDLSKGFTQVDYGSNVGAWSNYDASRIALLKRMFDQLRTVDSSVYFILEHFANNTEEKELSDYGMMLWGNHNHNYNEATMGYLNESNFEWISYKQRGWTNPYVVGYMESHDEERLMYRNISFGNASGSYNTKNLTTALARMEQAAAFFVTIPGPKMIWQFGELGYDVSIDFNGRVGEKPIRWEYFTGPYRRRLYNVYSALIHLRKNHEVFRTDDFSLSLSGAFKRINLNNPQMNVTIIGNFDVTFASGNPNFQHTGWWYNYLTGDSINITNTQSALGLQPGEYAVYTDVRLAQPNLTLAVDPHFQTFPVNVYPNPFTDDLELVFTLDKPKEVTVEIYTLTGQKVPNTTNRKWYSSGEQRVVIAGENLLPGTYFLKISEGNSSVVEKVVKW
ncbi:MAG: alpha-amylase family glycosyl hydrolase [Bacteroidia bacterium]|nr:alpha-amylase family glycosyl hydrolase [Bacteroidia bacterium]